MTLTAHSKPSVHLHRVMPADVSCCKLDKVEPQKKQFQPVQSCMSIVQRVTAKFY